MKEPMMGENQFVAGILERNHFAAAI